MDQMPLRQGKMMSDMTARCERAVGEISLVRLCMHACMCIWCVFNCGYKLSLGSFDKEVYVWVYIWKYLDYNLEPRFTFCIYKCGVGLK